MNSNLKYVGAFLLGATAALAVKKFMEMSPEEKDQMISKLKDKANKLKEELENISDRAKDYFEV